MSDLEYTDILLLGKTGMGKSTIGNILLGLMGKGIPDGRQDVETSLNVWPISDEEVVSDYPHVEANKVTQSKHLGRQSTAPTADSRPGLKFNVSSADMKTDHTESLPEFSFASVTASFTSSEGTAAKRKPNSDDEKNDSRPPESGHTTESCMDAQDDLYFVDEADESDTNCMAVQDDLDFVDEADQSDIDWSDTNGTKAFITTPESVDRDKKTQSGPGKSFSAEQRSSTSEQLQTLPGSVKATLELKYFTVGESTLSETIQPKLISSEISRNRILDTPGFATSGSPLPVFQANLQLIHQIALLQKVHSLKFRYVLYFLPCRAAPERADRTLKDEIAIIHHYFGESIWRRLVFALTAPSEYQMPEMFSSLTDGPLKEKGERVISVAMQDVWKSYCVEPQNFEAPHVIFIEQEESLDRIMLKIEHAIPKVDDGGLELRSDVCINCSARVHIKVNSKAKVASDSHVPTWATDKTGGSSVSTCHPRFTKTVIAGLIDFILTKETPGMCIKCHEKRGASTGCAEVGTMYHGIKVTHNTVQPMETIQR